jgi:hypothetical protein
MMKKNKSNAQASKIVKDFWNQFDKPFKYQKPPYNSAALAVDIANSYIMYFRVFEKPIKGYEPDKDKMERILLECNIQTDINKLLEAWSFNMNWNFKSIKSPAVHMREIYTALNDELNTLKQRLPPAINTLKLLCGQKAYKNFKPLHQTIQSLEYDLELYKAQAVKRPGLKGKRPDVKPLLDKDLNGQDYKQEYWNDIIRRTVNILRSDSTKLKQAHYATARLLKEVLDPGVWHMDIDTIQTHVKNVDDKGAPLFFPVKRQ